MSEILLHNHIVVVGVEWGKGSEEVRILYDILFDNMSPLVSVSVCNSECGWSSDNVALGSERWRWGGRAGGWLAGYIVLVNTGQSCPTRSSNQCFRIPGSFSLYRAPPSSTREARIRKVSPAVPASPQSAFLPSLHPPPPCSVLFI